MGWERDHPGGQRKRVLVRDFFRILNFLLELASASLNRSGRNRRGSCAADEVCSNLVLNKKKTLATAGVVREIAVLFSPSVLSRK
jgi:hypothetical protein